MPLPQQLFEQSIKSGGCLGQRVVETADNQRPSVGCLHRATVDEFTKPALEGWIRSAMRERARAIGNGSVYIRSTVPAPGSSPRRLRQPAIIS